MPTRIPLLALLGSFVAAPALLAQTPVPPAAKAAMERLAWMAGTWSGEGTYRGPEGPQTVIQTEEVRTALEGALLVVEGTGRAPGAGGDRGEVVFRAFGVLSAGDEPGTYRFAAWRGGGFVDARAELAADGTLTWGFERPGGEVRYVIDRPAPDVWRETGSWRGSGDETWRPFFEMTLSREDDGGGR